jgi:hypothetical protein
MTAAGLKRRLGRVRRRAWRAAQVASGLSAHQRAELVRAAAWVPATRLALSVLPWRWVSAQFERVPLRAGPPDWTRARAAVWAVDAVARRVLPRRPCLTQALVGRRALRQYGVETDLQIGAVRDGAGAFSAHAWLEHGGRVVLGGNNRIGHYARFTTFADRAAPPARPEPARPVYRPRVEGG